jgi:AraC-like DNA-binding protein
MIIPYFAGLRFGHHGHSPRCVAWLENWSSPCYALNFAYAGRISWQRPGCSRVILNAPVAWWTWPGAVFTYGSLPRETWHHYYVAFSGLRAARMFEQGLLPDRRRPYALIDRGEVFRELFDRLLAVLDESPQLTGEPVHLLEALLLELHRPTVALPAVNPAQARLGGLIPRIRSQPEKTWDFTAEAKSAGLSQVHFRRTFRKLTGLPPQQFVIQHRLTCASRLLRTSFDPVKAIAARSGFPDHFYFTKIFTRRYGLPPSAYRQESQRYRTLPAHGKSSSAAGTSRLK